MREHLRIVEPAPTPHLSRGRPIELLLVLPPEAPLTYAEAALLLCVSYSFVRRLARTGQIATVRRGTRVGIPRFAVSDYLSRNTRPAKQL